MPEVPKCCIREKTMGESKRDKERKSIIRLSREKGSRQKECEVIRENEGRITHTYAKRSRPKSPSSSSSSSFSSFFSSFFSSPAGAASPAAGAAPAWRIISVMSALPRVRAKTAGQKGCTRTFAALVMCWMLSACREKKRHKRNEVRVTKNTGMGKVNKR